MRRALAGGDLLAARTAAAELPRVDLDEAASLVVLIARENPTALDASAVRFLGRAPGALVQHARRRSVSRRRRFPTQPRRCRLPRRLRPRTPTTSPKPRGATYRGVPTPWVARSLRGLARALPSAPVSGLSIAGDRTRGMPVGRRAKQPEATDVRATLSVRLVPQASRLSTTPGKSPQPPASHRQPAPGAAWSMGNPAFSRTYVRIPVTPRSPHSMPRTRLR